MTQLPVDAPLLAAAEWDNSIFEIIFILIVFFCILFLAYVVTRFIAKRASGRMKSHHIEIVDTLAMSADTQLLIAKVGEEFFLVSKSQKQLSLLTKLALTAEDISGGGVQAPGFADSFKTVLESKLSRAKLQRNKRAGEEGGSSGGSGGSGGGSRSSGGGKSKTALATELGAAKFHDNIDKLKDMTER